MAALNHLRDPKLWSFGENRGLLGKTVVFRHSKGLFPPLYILNANVDYFTIILNRACFHSLHSASNIHLVKTMARIPKQSKNSSVEKKLLRQKRDRRKSCLEKKTREYSKICGADICLGIHIRQSGKVFIYSADTSGFWSFLSSQFVSLGENRRSQVF